MRALSTPGRFRLDLRNSTPVAPLYAYDLLPQDRLADDALVAFTWPETHHTLEVMQLEIQTHLLDSR